MKAKGGKAGWEYTFIDVELEDSNEELWKPLEIFKDCINLDTQYGMRGR